MRRSQPYRNKRIITVIRDLYFSGHPTSFAKKFEDHFPLHRGDDGNASREVPIPMVALVATGVSPYHYYLDQLCLHGLLAVCHSPRVAFG